MIGVWSAGSDWPHRGSLGIRRFASLGIGRLARAAYTGSAAARATVAAGTPPPGTALAAERGAPPLRARTEHARVRPRASIRELPYSIRLMATVARPADRLAAPRGRDAGLAVLRADAHRYRSTSATQQELATLDRSTAARLGTRGIRPRCALAGLVGGGIVAESAPVAKPILLQSASLIAVGLAACLLSAAPVGWGAAAAAGPASGCGDFLAWAGWRPPHAIYLGCEYQPDRQGKPLLARYQVEGRHAAAAEAYLGARVGLGRLEHVC